MKQPLSGKIAFCHHMGNCHSDQPRYFVSGKQKMENHSGLQITLYAFIFSLLSADHVYQFILT